MRRAAASLLALALAASLGGCVTINVPGGGGKSGGGSTPATSGSEIASAPSEVTAAPDTGPVVTPPADALHSPAQGGAERKAILDSLRPPIEADVGQSVVFKVNRIRVQDGWAFVNAQPLRPSGATVDYSKTRYRAQIEAGAFDDAVSALLHHQNGAWKVVVFDIGATDVVWDPWPAQYGAPKGIFVVQ
jgi:hypothetical protein